MKFRIKRGFKGAKTFGKIMGYDYHSKVKKRVGLALIILIIALIIFTGYFLFFYERGCDNAQCFVDAMRGCRSVSWIREDEQSSWLYIIKGGKEDSCKIDVELLEVKQGTIDSEKLQGKKMTCILQRGSVQFPEKDISRCSGILKEELQELIIQRMHNYLLKNVGQINEEFEGF